MGSCCPRELFTRPHKQLFKIYIYISYSVHSVPCRQYLLVQVSVLGALFRSPSIPPQAERDAVLYFTKLYTYQQSYRYSSTLPPPERRLHCHAYVTYYHKRIGCFECRSLCTILYSCRNTAWWVLDLETKTNCPFGALLSLLSRAPTSCVANLASRAPFQDRSVCETLFSAHLDNHVITHFPAPVLLPVGACGPPQEKKWIE